MAQATLDTLTPLLRDHLHHEGRVRVWSLIVTILGDAVELRGGEVPTARLADLLEAMGISLAAQRTALSRLVADGWIERRKDPRDNRATRYRFTEAGRAEFVPAARLIYAAPGMVAREPWIMAADGPARGIPVGDGIALWPADFAPRDLGFAMVGTFTTPTRALRAGTVTDAHAASVQDLQALLRFLETTFDPVTGRDAMVARTILIHRWRRHVLRFPELPKELAPEGWTGLSLRADVGRAYARLQLYSDTYLNAYGPGFEAMPPADPEFYDRFKPRLGDRK